MLEIRLHGRGGQGAVTAAELIAVAAYYDGKESQAFPSFGVERRGAPIESYARISEKKIRLREQIYCPDYIIILDPTLLDAVDVLSGAKCTTEAAINSDLSVNDLIKKYPDLKKIKKVHSIPATKMAIDLLGAPIINTIMLGFFAGITKLIKKDSMNKAISERFGGALAEKNIKAAGDAYNMGTRKHENTRLRLKTQKQ
ncbi:MAG: pyruvate ferredoxin oxidoreductase subunit gamma [bacterium]